MRKIQAVLIITIVVISWCTNVQATENSKEQVDAYYTALKNQYEVSQDVISKIHTKDIALEDLPVILWLANQAKLDPSRVVNDRKGGLDWLDIAKIYDMGPEVYYISIGAKFSSSTFSPIFEKYRSLPEAKWKTLVLSDDEVVNLVNLRFISSVHDYSMFEIMALRDNGKNFPRINLEIKNAKSKLIKEEKMKKKKEKKSGN